LALASSSFPIAAVRQSFRIWLPGTSTCGSAGRWLPSARVAAVSSKPTLSSAIAGGLQHPAFRPQPRRAVPGQNRPFWFGVGAATGTPKDVIARINAAVGAAGADPAIRQRLRDQGAEPAIPSLQTPEAFGAFHKAEVEKWWPFIKTANIKAE